MPNFNIVRKSSVEDTFRVQNVIGRFDLPSNETVETFTGSIDIPDDWNVGAIVGNSGTGKTTIATEVFNQHISSFDSYRHTHAVIDDMPEDCSVEEISKAFNSVGFSLPPSWIKPYAVLSNGEKMRVDLARALLSDNECFLFDEFTSVVDRTVAKVGSLALQKAVRKKNEKFIAVSCHNDILEWLQPDWVFDTNTMTFTCGQKKSLQLRSKYSKQVINQSGAFLKSITI